MWGFLLGRCGYSVSRRCATSGRRSFVAGWKRNDLVRGQRMNRWSIVVGAVLLAVGAIGTAVWLLLKRGRPVVGAATPSGQAVVVAATPPPPGL
jgi:hypothetical protein